MACKNCKFWVITPEEKSLYGPGWNTGIVFRRNSDVHYCHRYPQKVMKHEDDWCGEFRKAEIDPKFKELLEEV